jgi:hypothetical protein
MTAEILNELLQASNEVLAAAIVVLAMSLVLYNLSRNRHNRVARTSGAVLACIMPPYIADIFISLAPITSALATALRLQWIGIAFMPAALFHLSDALLATTGLPSRGRRRRAVRVLYLISFIFLITATLTDVMIVPVLSVRGVSLQGSPLLGLFITYYVIISLATFINVNRARQRCLTRSAERRMAYLQLAILTPAIGIFPFSVLLTPDNAFSLPVTVSIVVANFLIVGMLIFLSYPLSFFGSDKPDRVVKVDLLRFLLRGPGTALITLGVIVFTTRATRILGLEGIDFMPFAVVSAVLVWQWGIHIILPYLEKWLVYRNEDTEQISKLQDLTDRVLMHSDLTQLVEATLEASCNYLRVEQAFVAATIKGQVELIGSVGNNSLSNDALTLQSEALLALVETIPTQHRSLRLVSFGEYKLAPLYSSRIASHQDALSVIGVMGFSNGVNSSLESSDTSPMLHVYIQRVEHTLDDLILQEEVFGALEGLLPQISTTRARAEDMEYRPRRDDTEDEDDSEPADEVYEQVRAALRHYWGGPGISRSRLLDWSVVQSRLVHHDTPLQALRAALQESIDRQRPEGERSLTAPEWTIYNILTMRFIDGKKVRDVARRLSMSEPDLYRKQRLAIEAVAHSLIELERTSTQAQK